MAMISHVFIGVNDFEGAFTFYSPILPTLGFVLKFREPDYPWAGWTEPGVARPLFLVGRPWDGNAAQPGNGQMVALLAPSRDAVDAAYAAALAHGGVDEGAPGLRLHYHANYYGAYFRDPEGNKLCVCCHEPAGA